MRYVIADIHGCYEEYKELMKKINLSEEDHLYVLGDALDRGPEPMKLSYDERQAVCDFLENANVYDEVLVNDKRYVLVHAGISNFSEEKTLDEYDVLDFICERTDYGRRYYQESNTYVITGHTPTMCIDSDALPEVYIGNGHIALDCGCIYGGRLAAYCVETDIVIYVKAKNV